MICQQCASENPEGARFCNQCGSRIDAAPEAAAGRRTYTPRHLVEQVLKTRAALIGERKRVTVLFVDIKGSTRLAEQAGAEAWHLILDRYFGLLTAAVHRYEGTVNQYTGDGIMALFGAPIAHEDHAQRACLAALEMQREVRRYADELRLKSGLNLSIRAGLNTGEVIVGAIGDDLRMDYTAQGLTVNLAARMENICEPGRIYATRNTAVLAEGYFRLRDLGEMKVAGQDQPLRVYEVEGEGPARTRLERGLARAANFVGREAERARLRAALEESRAGRGQVLTVVGEGGIGKSRLCHEFTREAERGGMVVHRASAVPYSSALPFYPVQALTRSRLGLAEQVGGAEARRIAAGGLLLFEAPAAALLPRLLEFLGIAESGADAGGADRRQLFELLARLLPRAEGPQVLLVEDLHFADPGTEAFIEMLAREVAGTSTLLLLNFRPDYAGAWLAGQPHERIEVRALGQPEIETVARELLGGHASVAALPGEFAARAAGNPFYVEEAVAALAEAGHLSGAHGLYTLDQPITKWPIPDTVHALVASRVDRLDEGCKALLQAASVIGMEFRPALLARLAGVELAQCESGLESLRRRGFVHAKAEGHGGHAFCHPLTQDLVYRAQLETQRRAAHRRLAELLEQDHPMTATPDDTSAQIAHHWHYAGEWTRAAQWHLYAARWAISHGANATVSQYRFALKNLDRAEASPEVDRLRVQALAGLVRMAAFADVSHDEAQRAYEQGLALAESRQDLPVRAELLLSYASDQLRRGDAAKAVKLAAEAVRLAVDDGARELVGRFRMPLLLTHGTAGYPREGLALVSEAGGSEWLIEPIGPDNYISRGLYALLLAWLGDLPEARCQLEAVLAYAEATQRLTSWLHVNAVDLGWFSGDHSQVLREGQRALQRAEEFGSSLFRALALRGFGFAHVLAGDPHTAVSLLEKALPLVAPGAHAHQFQSNTLSALARAYLRTGAIERAHHSATAAIASAQASHSRVWEIMCWLAYFELPTAGPWSARIPEGIARVAELIDSSGAEGTRPWWWEAQARWAGTAAERETFTAKAIEAFERIGAPRHVERLRGQRASLVVA